MKILGIESSSLVASVAVVTDGLVTAEYTVNFKKTHSQTLLPMIDEVSRMLELDLNDVDAIAVSGGPGSYTGLRIGSATAKGLGLALNKPLVHVPTMDAMAYNLYGTSALICPVMDARRGQVYTGLYHYEDAFEVVKPQCGMDIHELIGELNARSSGKRNGNPGNHDCSVFLCPGAVQPPERRQRCCSGKCLFCGRKDGIGHGPCAGLPAESPGRTRAGRGKAAGKDG